MVLSKGGRLRVLGPDAHATSSVPRIGNLLVLNDNYCKFEDWLMPILDQMVLEQNTEVRLEQPGAGGGNAFADGMVGVRGGRRCSQCLSPPRV